MVTVLVTRRSHPYFGKKVQAHWFGFNHWVRWWADGGYYHLGPDEFEIARDTQTTERASKGGSVVA